ncbi:hypothetical protein LXL04_004679 [Taraxacum kok-saghyz]
MLKYVYWEIRKSGRYRCELTGVWKNIMNMTKELGGVNLNANDLFKKEMGRGTQTSFWYEDLSGSGILQDIFPLLFRLESKKQCSVSDLYQRLGATIQWPWGWKRLPSNQEENIEKRCCDLILQNAQIGNEEDKWKLTHDHSGVFSVSSMRNLWETTFCKVLPYKHWWNNWVPIKINFCGWRAELAKRGVPMPSSFCSFCGQREENDLHLFLECNWVNDVWTLWKTWSELELGGVQNVEQLLHLNHVSCQSPKQKKAIHVVMMVTLWVIWKARNDRIFNNRWSTPGSLLDEIMVQSFLWIKNRGKELQLNWNSWCIFPFAVH